MVVCVSGAPRSTHICGAKARLAKAQRDAAVVSSDEGGGRQGGAFLLRLPCARALQTSDQHVPRAAVHPSKELVRANSTAPLDRATQLRCAWLLRLSEVIQHRVGPFTLHNVARRGRRCCAWLLSTRAHGPTASACLPLLFMRMRASRCWCECSRKRACASVFAQTFACTAVRWRAPARACTLCARAREYRWSSCVSFASSGSAMAAASTATACCIA